MLALGFGCIEERERETIKRRLLAAAINGKDFDEVSKTWNAERNKYDEMNREEAPERYTKFWIYEGAIHYHHIHRRHPFSPDGWALLRIDEPIVRELRDSAMLGGK